MKNKLESLVELASLAPSAHNSQPWLFVIDEAANSITIKPNFQRHLDYSDPQKREFYLSLGTAAANLALGAQGYGMVAEVKYEDKQAGGIWTTVSFSSNGSPEQPEIIKAILNRHNNRNFFDATPLPQTFIDDIKNLAQGKVTLHIITDREVKQKIKQIVGEATMSAFGDKNFTGELSSWMHPSLKKYRDGFVGYNLGIPWPMSFLFPTMLKYLPLAKPQTKMQTDMLEHAPAYAVLSSSLDNPSQWLITGQVFEQIAITAEKNNVKLGAFGAPVETGEYYKQLQQALGTNERPQMFFRLGFCNKIPKKSPRLELSQIITKN